MRRLGIDLETFSSVSIRDCGVYRYSEAPDFEILLMAFKVDDEPVQRRRIDQREVDNLELDE